MQVYGHGGADAERELDALIVDLPPSGEGARVARARLRWAGLKIKSAVVTVGEKSR